MMMLPVLSAFIVFAFGAAIGSFMNVLVDRLSTGRSVFAGRSYCENCKKTLQPFDLIPVFSYLLLGGKCRYCKSKIPLRILFVEVLVGLYFASVFWFGTSSGMNYYELAYLLLVSIPFIAIFFADLDYGIIPDQLTMSIMLITLPYLIFLHPDKLVASIISAIVACLIFLTLYLVTKGRGMGFGDVKFAAAIGLFLGFPKIIAGIYLAFLTGAFVAVILILLGKKKFKKSTIAFGPFLAFSALISYIFGQFIVDFFKNYFSL